MHAGALKLFRKLALYAVPFLLTCAAFAVYMLYVVPAHTPEAIHHSVQEDKIHRLLVLATSTPRVIFAGDSRANANIIPDVFTQKTGATAVNVGVNFGTLSETYDAFKENGVLGKKRLILISETSYDINDSVFHFQDIDWKVMQAEPWGTRKLHYFLNYANQLISFEFNQFQRFLSLEDIRKDALITPAQFSAKGYSEDTGHYIPLPPGEKDTTNVLYVDPKTDGFKLTEFLRAIRGLGESNDTIVLYLGPTAPVWRKELEGTIAPEVEEHFIEVIKEAIKPYPNMHFIDFHSKDYPGLTDSVFADGVHLTKEGATTFTSLFADELLKQNLLK